MKDEVLPRGSLNKDAIDIRQANIRKNILEKAKWN